jgi:hypothetical protein
MKSQMGILASALLMRLQTHAFRLSLLSPRSPIPMFCCGFLSLPLFDYILNELVSKGQKGVFCPALRCSYRCVVDSLRKNSSLTSRTCYLQAISIKVLAVSMLFNNYQLSFKAFKTFKSSRNQNNN